MSFGDLPTRLATIREVVAQRQAAAGWSHPVQIVAVAKGFGVEAVAAALAAGLADIGENRVQEALAKMDQAAARGLAPVWHLVGHLQRNKAKFIPGRFGLVHSIDSLELARELDRRAAQAGMRVRVLLQVNLAGEEQKRGCTAAAAPQLARELARCEGLALEGLMTIAPFTIDPVVQHAVFSALRDLRDGLQEEGVWLPTLSMGMSGDYASAVEQGATLIRLGTALFGPRGETA